MSVRRFHRRWAAPIIAALFVASFVTSWRPLDNGPQQHVLYCAIFTDSVGLYVDNPVTQMGYKIGTVKKIEARDADVKVMFSIDEKRAVPHNVNAIIRSPSILADRALELVGNYDGGRQLGPNDCVPLNRTSTPMSISQVIGSATKFVNGISPDGSNNLRDALDGISKAANANGRPTNELLTRSAKLLDNSDHTISDLGEITRNMAQLTSIIRANRVPLKQIVVDMEDTNTMVTRTVIGAKFFAHCLPELVQLVNDIELELGPDLQLALDETSDVVRILSPHYKFFANMLNPLPRWISGLNVEPPGAIDGGLAKHLNNHLFALLPYRPPLFRIPTPNGTIACGRMNATLPGSCADVGGRPYAVDVALLQYVLTAAATR
jgi:virulence factor Mce-like protein